jgi:hypothetical protein
MLKRETVLVSFPDFRQTSWEHDYAKAISQIAAQTAMDRESALDLGTMQYIIFRSVDHDRAQTAIVRGFAETSAAYVGAVLDLGLSGHMTRYDRGEAYGILEARDAEPDLIAKVEEAMERRCGAVPNLANPTDGIPIVEWLMWCIEVMQSGNADHMPEDDVQRQLAHIYQQSGATKKAVEAMLDRRKVQAFLDRPVNTILERVLRG